MNPSILSANPVTPISPFVLVKLFDRFPEAVFERNTLGELFATAAAADRSHPQHFTRPGGPASVTRSSKRAIRATATEPQRFGFNPEDDEVT